MEKLQTSNVSTNNGNIKCPIGKSIFCSKFAVKTLRATVANADIGSLKSLHTFLKNKTKTKTNRQTQKTKQNKTKQKQKQNKTNRLFFI